MTNRFVIEVKHSGAAGGSGSSARSSSQASAAAAVDREAKRAEASAKKAADAQVREATRAAKAQEKAASNLYKAQNAVFALAQKAASKAADAQIREAKRAADTIASYQKSKLQPNRFSFGGPSGGGLAGLDKTFSAKAAEQKRYEAAIGSSLDSIFSNFEAESRKEQSAAKKAADAKIAERKRETAALIKEAERAANAGIAEAKREALNRAKAFSRVAGAATSIGYGAYRAAGQISGGVGRAAAGISAGGIGGILGSAPRAAGDLLQAGGAAAASLARGFGVALGKLLPGALGFIGKAIGNAFAVVGEVAGALGAAAGQIAGFIGDKLGLALKVTLGAAVGIGIAGITQALKGEDLREFFEGFAKASGETATQGIEKLRAATKGMISDIDLLRAANQAWQSGAVETEQQFAELAGLAVTLGKNIGERPVDAIDKFTQALASGNAKGIKPFVGATVDFDRAIKSSAESSGKLAEDLTDTEKAAIRYRVVIDAAKNATRGMASQQKNVSDAFDTVKASVTNSLESIGRALLPALNSVLKAVEPIAAAVGKFFDNNNKAISDAIGKSIAGIGQTLAALPEIIGNISLKEVFQLATLQAEKLWINFTEFAAKAGNAIVDLIGAAFDKVIQGLATGAGKIAGLLPGAGQIASGLLGIGAQAAAGSASRGVTSAGQAFSAPNSPESTARLAAIEGEQLLVLKQIATRAVGPAAPAVLPQSTPTQGAATGTLGSFAAGATFNASGANTGTLGSGSADFITQAAALNGAMRLLNAGFGDAVEKLGLTDEQLAQISENFAAADIRAEFERYKDEQTAGLKAGIDGTEHLRRYWEDTVAELGSIEAIQQHASDLITRTANDEIAAREAIVEKFNAEKDGIVGSFKAAMDDIAARVKSAGDALRSAAGFGGEFGGADLNAAIPGKFKRAARKASRRATKALRHELNQQSAGLGDEDLINGGADRIFQSVAQKQVLGVEGGANSAQKALDEALNKLSDLTNEKDAAIAANAEQTAAIVEQINANQDADIAAFNTATEKLSELADSLKAQNDRLLKVEKSLESVSTRGS